MSKYKLSELYTLQMGKTPSRDNSSYWNNGNNKWISIADLSKSGQYISETKEKISDSAVKDSGIKLIPKNTLIMSFKLSIGKVALTACDMYSNEAIMSFIDNNLTEIIPEYAYYLFSAQKWDKGSNRAVMGKTLNKATLSLYEINIHPVDEQREIIEKLGKLNNLIELRKRELIKLDDLVKSQFIEMFGDPISNPHNWEKVPLSELADVKIGPFGSLLHKDDYIVGGHPLVNPSHIVDSQICIDNELTITSEKYEELKAYHLKVGDVVMGRRGEMGRCAVVTKNGLLCGTGSLIIRTKGEATADYLQKIISFPSFKKMIEDRSVGQTMPNLNVPIVSNFEIIRPPINIQKQYYEFVEQTDKSKIPDEFEVAA